MHFRNGFCCVNCVNLRSGLAFHSLLNETPMTFGILSWCFFSRIRINMEFPDGNKHANSVPQTIRCFALSPYCTMQTKQFQEFFLSILDFSNLDASSLLHSHACSDALMLVSGIVHSALAVLVLDHGGFDVSMPLHGLA